MNQLEEPLKTFHKWENQERRYVFDEVKLAMVILVHLNRILDRLCDLRTEAYARNA